MPEVQLAPFGRWLHCKSMCDAVHIQSDMLRVVVLPKGAVLAGVYLASHRHNLVLGFADPKDHQRVPVYAGGIVGPLANRVRGGHAFLSGISHRMPLNEDNQVTLHSGPEGLHTQQWTVSEQTADAITLTCVLPDGACGLPGRREIMVSYQVAQTRLSVEITATTDQPTPMNVAAHPYWNLDGAPTLEGHVLRIPANRYTPLGPRSLPTGQINAVAETEFDFRSPTTVPLKPGLDVNYCLGIAPAPAPQPAAVLTGATGLRLLVETTAPGLQVYNGAHLPYIDNVLTQGRALRPYGGIALEPQYWPDALHHPHFPNVILTPDQTYRQHNTYTLTPARDHA